MGTVQWRRCALLMRIAGTRIFSNGDSFAGEYAHGERVSGVYKFANGATQPVHSEVHPLPPSDPSAKTPRRVRGAKGGVPEPPAPALEESPIMKDGYKRRSSSQGMPATWV